MQFILLLQFKWNGLCGLVTLRNKIVSNCYTDIMFNICVTFGARTVQRTWNCSRCIWSPCFRTFCWQGSCGKFTFRYCTCMKLYLHLLLCIWSCQSRGFSRVNPEKESFMLVNLDALLVSLLLRGF